MYNCSSQNLDKMPLSVPNFSDWVLLKDNNINNIDRFPNYLSKAQFLHLGGNILSNLNNSFLFKLQTSRSITWLNLAENRLTQIPTNFQELLLLQKIWLSGNPFHCDCSMLWMISWLNNFTTPEGEHIIQDYQDVRCRSGGAVGTPFYKLNEVMLGFYPKGLTILQKVLIGAGSGTGGLIIITLLILFIKRSRSLQFFIFY